MNFVLDMAYCRRIFRKIANFIYIHWWHVAKC